MRRTLIVVSLVGAFIAIVAACSVDVDLSNKKCPCPDGLLCDPSTNTCVTTLPTVPGTAEAGTPPPPACNGDDCKCEVDGDCRDPSRTRCGPNKTCVECVSAPADTCTAGGYCNDKNQCVVGCKTGADCQNGLRCQLTTHRCVECIVDPDCSADGGSTKKCSPSGKCADACATADNTACPGGGTCCGGFCLAVSDDVLNCGVCGKVCSTTNATPACTAGVCTFKCADGYRHCTTAENAGCETNIRTVTNCGGCNITCTSPPILNTNGVACSGDKCTYTTCAPWHYDKNTNANDGCEADCGDKNVDCCPGANKCKSGSGCKANGTCF